MIEKTVLSPVNVNARKVLGVRPGDTVRVMLKIQEKGKTRLQAFEGLVLTMKHGTEAGATFTVRKVASGVGVEKTFPLYSPMVDKIEILKRTKVRRAKLYYIREKAAKEIRRAMRNAFTVGTSIEGDIAEKDRISKEAEAEEAARVAAEAEVAAAEAAKAEQAEAAAQAQEAPVEVTEEPAAQEAVPTEEEKTEEKKD